MDKNNDNNCRKDYYRTIGFIVYLVEEISTFKPRWEITEFYQCINIHIRPHIMLNFLYIVSSDPR